MVVLAGHAGPVKDFAELEGGNSVATACDDGCVRVFDTENGELRLTLAPPATEITERLLSVATVGSGLCVSGGMEGYLSVWKLAGSTLISRKQFGARVQSLSSFAPGHLAVGVGFDVVFLRFNENGTYRRKKEIRGAHRGYITSVAVCSGRVVTASEDRTAKVFDLESATLIQELDTDSSWALCADLNEKSIVMGLYDGRVLIYDFSTLRTVGKLSIAHVGPVVSIALAGDQVASFSADGYLAVTERERRKLMSRIPLGFLAIKGMLLRRGKYVAVGEANPVLFGDRSEVESANASQRNQEEGVENEMQIRSVDDHTIAYGLERLDGRVRELLRVLQSSRSTLQQKLDASSSIEKDIPGLFIDRERISTPPNEGCPEKLGAGGFGTVFRTDLIDESGQRIPVAAKTLSVDVSDCKEKIQFIREVVFLKSLDHPNILRFYGSWWPKEVKWERGDPFGRGVPRSLMLTELMDKNLREACKSNLLASPQTQVRVLLDIARALKFLHKENVLHNDVKPENVLVRLDGQRIVEVKVSDFGLSRVVRSGQSGSSRSLARGGTLYYQAPEALSMSDRPNVGMDVWSFGVLCTYVALGRTAMTGEEELEVVKAAKSGDLVAKCLACAADIQCAAVRAVAELCFASCPQERPSMAQITEKLEKQLTE